MEESTAIGCIEEELAIDATDALVDTTSTLFEVDTARICGTVDEGMMMDVRVSAAADQGTNKRMDGCESSSSSERDNCELDISQQ